MTINSNNCNGFISAQMKSTNSITFCADLPKNAKVDYIRLIGDIDVNGVKLTNPIIDDIDGVVVSYHKEGQDGAIATAYFVDGVSKTIIGNIQNYVIEQFEVECIEVCPCCGR